jgi:stage II sporulation protein R
MLAVMIGFILCVAVNALGNDQKDISNSCLRLHVIANSDTKEDQTLKLKVRDAVLKGADDIFDNIKNLAQNEVKNQGYDYIVACSLEKTYFPTRQYDNFTLPAGEYDALKVVIGRGEGKNWWCVMFPPLCTNGIENKDAIAYFEKNLSRDEFALLTDRTENKNIEFRFKIVELFEEFKQKVKQMVK